MENLILKEFWKKIFEIRMSNYFEIKLEKFLFKFNFNKKLLYDSLQK